MQNCIKLIIIALASVIIVSCEKNEFLTDSSARLNFSVDTLMFDTVFATIGSTTRHFKVYNPYSQSIKINSIKLAKGTESHYRLNINGFVGNELNNFELQSKDSIFIFVELTVRVNSPMIVNDSVVFQFNGNTQDVDLWAYGQDIHLINSEILKTQTWTSEKPYLIFNYAFVDTLQTLTIEAGTQIHFHSQAYLLAAGNIIANGSLEKPIVFQGDRLEYMYRDVPGQWSGLFFLNGSKRNILNYVEVKNAVTGIRLGVLNNTDFPELQLNNSRVEHHTYSGIWALGAEIFATNNVLADCGFYVVALLNGGNYRFYHCTVANFWANSNRSEPAVVLSNNFEYDNILYHNDLQLEFGNSIIYGSLENELGLAVASAESEFQYNFNTCLLRIKENDFDTNNPQFFINNIITSKFDFYDPYEPYYNYQLDTLSPAKDVADKAIIERPELFEFLNVDFNGNSRLPLPDIGAYERME